MLLLDLYQDITEVWRVIRNDDEILKLMELTNASPIEIAKRIIKRSQWDGLIDGKRICIYYRPFRMSRNDIVREQIIEVDVHVPIIKEADAYYLQNRVKELIHDRVINGRRFYLEMPLGELATAQGFMCVGLRFRSYALI